MNKFYLFMLTLLFSCSIISDDYLKELPEKVKLSKISASANISEIEYSKKTIVGIVSYPTNNKVVIDWSGELDLFYFKNPVVKITYDLNAAGFATTISVLLSDGFVVVDQLSYNASNQVNEMIIPNHNAQFKFFYENNSIDSVSRERHIDIDGSEYFGFYKTVPAYENEYEKNVRKMIGILPFDKHLPYTLSGEPSGCTYNSFSTTSNNDFFKSSYYEYSDEYYPTPSWGKNTHLKFRLPFVDYDGTRNEYSFSIVTDIQHNFFDQIYSVYQTYPSDCLSINYGLNNFSLMPSLFPDAGLLQMLIVGEEFTSIYYDNSRVPPLSDVNVVYGYEPVNK